VGCACVCGALTTAEAPFAWTFRFGQMDDFLGSPTWLAYALADLDRMQRVGLLSRSHSGVNAFLDSASDPPQKQSAGVCSAWIEPHMCDDFPAVEEVMERLYVVVEMWAFERCAGACGVTCWSVMFRLGLPFELNLRTGSKFAAPLPASTLVTYLSEGHVQEERLDNPGGQQDNGFSVSCVFTAVRGHAASRPAYVMTLRNSTGKSQLLPVRSGQLVMFRSRDVTTSVAPTAECAQGATYMSVSFFIHGVA